jgi:hypothetical protein
MVGWMWRGGRVATRRTSGEVDNQEFIVGSDLAAALLQRVR